MTKIFELKFTGNPRRAEIDRLRKLLNLTPKGRLDDVEDAEFGHRTLRDVVDAWIWLGLWRRTATSWAINMSSMGDLPAAPLVDQIVMESTTAASRSGLALVEVWPNHQRTEQIALGLPTHHALTVSLGGVSHDEPRNVLATLRMALGLHRESGGDTGVDRGWRYLQRDDKGTVLMQLSWDGNADTAEMLVLHDNQGLPIPQVLHGCFLQITATAAMAGLSSRPADPPTPPSGPSVADIHSLAVDVHDIDQLWERFHVEHAPTELKRGILLTALARHNSPTAAPPSMAGINRVLPEPGRIPDQLREQAKSFLLASKKTPEPNMSRNH